MQKYKSKARNAKYSSAAEYSIYYFCLHMNTIIMTKKTKKTWIPSQRKYLVFDGYNKHAHTNTLKYTHTLLRKHH